MLTARRCCVLLLFAALAGCSLPYQAVRSHYGLPDFTDDAGPWTKRDVVTRDGVKLKTHVLLPAGATRAPLVVMRNPYPFDILFTLPCGVFVRYGIGCVVQDVRGQRESGGEWYPLIHEAEDGEDLLAWLVQQPFAGALALVGQSYLAGTALAASQKLPPQVKTMVLSVFGTNLRRSIADRGLLQHELATAWAAFMPGRERPADAADSYRRALAFHPHLEADVSAFGHQLPFYREWLEASLPSAALWQRPATRAFLAVPEQIHVPVLFIQSMDDPFLPAGLDTFERLASKPQSLLALLPTNHVGMQGGDVQVEGVDGLYMWKLTVPWLLHELKGVPLPFEAHGTKSWARNDGGPRFRPEWPGPTRQERFELRTKALAAEPCPQRSLAPAVEDPDGPAEPERATEAIGYRYNPLDPWLSEGGARGIGFLITRGVTAGPVKQHWDCRRRDVVRFATEAFATPQRLLGSMELRLSVRSSVKDTAFIAKLVDIGADGTAVHITDAVATLRLPTEKDETLVPYEPGTQRTVELEFLPTEWVLKPGHRLGLWVSSSSFPMFAVHPNTEKPWYLETAPLLANQTLELGGRSTLLLHLGD